MRNRKRIIAIIVIILLAFGSIFIFNHIQAENLRNDIYNVKTEIRELLFDDESVDFLIEREFFEDEEITLHELAFEKLGYENYDNELLTDLIVVRDDLIELIQISLETLKDTLYTDYDEAMVILGDLDVDTDEEQDLKDSIEEQLEEVKVLIYPVLSNNEDYHEEAENDEADYNKVDEINIVILIEAILKLEIIEEEINELEDIIVDRIELVENEFNNSGTNNVAGNSSDGTNNTSRESGSGNSATSQRAIHKVIWFRDSGTGEISQWRIEPREWPWWRDSRCQEANVTCRIEHCVLTECRQGNCTQTQVTCGAEWR